MDFGFLLPLGFPFVAFWMRILLVVGLIGRVIMILVISCVLLMCVSLLARNLALRSLLLKLNMQLLLAVTHRF